MQGSLRGERLDPVTDRRRLIVMRHAKAEPYAATDHVRRLTDRGRRDAAAAAAHLVALGVVPEYAVVSTAERTRMTWAEVAAAAAPAAKVSFDEAVYAGGAEEALESLQQVPEEVGTVMYVGHNPAAAYLAHLLDDGDGDPEAVSGLLRGFPAGALVVFDVVVPWLELGAESGRALSFFAPV
jgi:phosphohistidine phosphatase